MKKILYLLAILAVIVVFSCKKEPVIPPPAPDEFDQNIAPYLKVSRTPADYTVEVPAGYYQDLLGGAQANPYKAELGRVIFYDKHLSKDGKISCASCHIIKNAFADPVAKSTGIFGRQTKRNSMALLNNIWLGGALGIDSTGSALLPLFWDSRSMTVADQSAQAFTSPLEMGMTMPEVVKIVNEQPYYKWLFQKAWGDSIVREERIFASISHFISAMGTRDTYFDQALQKAGGIDSLEVNFKYFTADQNRGKVLFMENCESCHGSLTSVPHIFEANNGLESPYIDQGKGAITGTFHERGIFKVPGLRNIAHSAPYMHDGRFATLDEVVEHYNSGVKQVFGLHGDLLTFNPVNQTYSPKRLNLSAEDKKALIEFMLTLTDEKSLNDPKFSDPFK